MKSYWILVNGRFKYGTDQFCPYCHIQKQDIEEGLRCIKILFKYTNFLANTTLCPKQRSGNIGGLDVQASDFIFCFLHAKLRLTETILRHQIRGFLIKFYFDFLIIFEGYYDWSTNKAQSLEKWTNLLQELTGSSSIRVKVKF